MCYAFILLAMDPHSKPVCDLYIKLNSLRAKWPMEPALISGFCSVKRMLPAVSGTHLHTAGRMERWVCLGGKEARTNIQISAKLGSNWGTCGRKTEILPTAYAGKKVAQMFKSRQSRDHIGELVVGRQRSYQLHQPVYKSC